MDKGYMEWKYLNDGNLEVIKSLGTRGITESSLNLNKEDSPLQRCLCKGNGTSSVYF